MYDNAIFSIADIKLNLVATAPLKLPVRNAPYTGFERPFLTTKEKEGISHTVRITSSSATIPSDAIHAFSADTWSAYKHGFRTFLQSTDRVPKKHAWTASIEQESSTLHCPGIDPQQTTEYQRHPFSYAVDQILLFHLLHRFHAVLIHSMGFVQNNMGIVCAGKSGAGKSTLARIIEPKGVHVLSDDRIIIRQIDDQQYLYGTPWPGEGQHARNEGHPLSHLLFLVQSEENKLVPLSSFEAAQRLMPVCSIPWYDEGMITAYFAIIDRIVRDIPCAELHFTRSDHVLDVLNDLKA